MPKIDQNRRDSDSDSIELAAAYLEATRAAESMPPAISGEIWARLERAIITESDLDGRAGDSEEVDIASSSKRQWWVAASIAAALLLALSLSPWTRGWSQGSSQASAAYRARSSGEHHAVSETVRRQAEITASERTSPAQAATQAAETSSSLADGSRSGESADPSAMKPEEAVGAPQRTLRRRRPAKEEEASEPPLAAADGEGSSSREADLHQPASPSGSSLAAETRALAKAREALAGGDPGGALDLLDRYSLAFPSGFLGEESAALRIIALCRSARISAGRAAADEFFRAYPSSALRARVQGACPPRR